MANAPDDVPSKPARARRSTKRAGASSPVTAPEPVAQLPVADVPAAAAATDVVAPPPASGKAKEPAKGEEFLVEQRALLLEERASYTKQADELKAEADSLALEHEPGDVQFDEEGGEGGTSNVDRELDLVLSAQARFAVAEIDRALAKVDAGNYGLCEQCGQPIPQARLKALPYAALCVACKSGGLSRR